MAEVTDGLRARVARYEADLAALLAGTVPDDDPGITPVTREAAGLLGMRAGDLERAQRVWMAVAGRDAARRRMERDEEPK